MNNTEYDNDQDYSIHDKIQQIVEETNVDRKAQISNRIKTGDAFSKSALLIAFFGFFVFWLIVALL